MSIMQQEKTFCKAHKELDVLIEFVCKCSNEESRIDQAERGIFDGLLQIGKTLLEKFVEMAGDGDEGETFTRDEKELRRFSDKHQRPYRSIFGTFSISRHVYGVREGQKILWAPLDARLGLPAGEHSYVLEDWLQRHCVNDTFRESVTSLRDLLGVKTSVRAAERMNRALAEYTGPFRLSQNAVAGEDEAEVLVVTADGKGVPMRRALDQRIGASEGENGTRKQMAYLGAVYSIAPFVRSADDVIDEFRRQRREQDRPQPQNKRVWAEMTKIHEGAVCRGRPGLFIHLALEARARDPKRRKPLVCVMDGEHALWAEQQEWLPRAITVLDIYHVSEYLWKAAHCFHAKESRAARQFVERYLKLILEGKVEYVYGHFGRLAREHGLKGAKLKSLQRVIGYFKNHRNSMRYDEYLAAGYPIGSGVIEGTCKHLVKDRMERSGMRWEIEGAAPMLQTRATYINGEWDTFIQYRIETEQAALYGQSA